MTLKTLRKKIDAIDAKIVKLLHKRAKAILRIAKIKRKAGMAIYSPAREKEILERVKTLRGPLSASALERVFSEVISVSRALERPLSIAYLGPKATFTEMAAVKKFGRSAKLVPLPSIPNVFQEVERGTADFGVVPVESSAEGSVTSTLDMFFTSNLEICGEVTIDVDHCLLSNSKISEVKKLYCHPQAFAQCEGWIAKNLPNAEVIEVSSTARAAERAAKEKHSAAVACELAAKEYKIKIRARRIQDELLNKTRFLIIGKIRAGKPMLGKTKTSILFTVKHVPGALFNALRAFSDYKINMTKIESRPIKGKLWEYAFFVDFQGHRDDAKVKAALERLKENCIELKILGSYPEETSS